MAKQKNGKTGIGVTSNTDREQTGGSDREPTAKGRIYPTGECRDLAAVGTSRVPFNGSREAPSLAFMLSCYDVWSATPEAPSSIGCAPLLNPNGGAASAAPAEGAKIE